MIPCSFSFGGKNSSDFGLLAKGYDFLLPEKRQQKINIPFRHGAYDFGGDYYNERNLRVRCVWVGKKTRNDIRDISFWLSSKGKIIFPEEPDKYYIGELYDSNELIMHYSYSNYTTTDGEFELNFICEPFAYKTINPINLKSGINYIKYDGTVQAPTLIILKNNNDYAVENVQILVTKNK